MKKKLLLVLMVTCMLVGCGSQAKSDTETAKKADTDKATEVTKKETETQPTEQDTQKAQEPIGGNAAGVANWHDTEEQIIEKQDGEINTRDGDTNNGWIGYDTTIDGHNAFLYYYIDPNYGCYEVDYIIYDFDLDTNLCKSEYDNLVSILTNKYGEPKSNEKEILSSMAGVSGDDIDFLLGHIDYTAMWELDDKDIQMWAFYNSQQNGMRIEINYYAKDYSGQGYVNSDTNGL